MVTSIPYPQLMQIIKKTPNKRTQALIAFQYASAARIGELLHYKHKVKKPENEQRIYYTNGLLKSKFHITPTKITWEMPNFKQHAHEKAKKYPFVFKKEQLLWNVIINWLQTNGEQLFKIKESHARKTIREEIKPHSSHTLRKSRATHLVEIFGLNAYQLKQVVGWAKLDTSAQYVSTISTEKQIEDKLEQMTKETNLKEEKTQE